MSKVYRSCAQVQRKGIPPFHYMVAAAGGKEIVCADVSDPDLRVRTTTAVYQEKALPWLKIWGALLQQIVQVVPDSLLQLARMVGTN